ncbi:hypothetical protein B0T18DRAFT_410117 [Schizothecium vesticola]|uniref:Uncharacterized protein n=1 Tax=Schizothecium vesticola TaxID=314040 RepID=A0AA40EUH0_9PEZI|nr:hypothetical protein B0T18DRAFT_410117 [Schizothecium vesticola]
MGWEEEDSCVLGSERPMIPYLFFFCGSWGAGSWPGMGWGRLIEEDNDGDSIPGEQALRWRVQRWAWRYRFLRHFWHHHYHCARACMGLKRAGCLVDGVIQYFLEMTSPALRVREWALGPVAVHPTWTRRQTQPLPTLPISCRYHAKTWRPLETAHPRQGCSQGCEVQKGAPMASEGRPKEETGGPSSAVQGSVECCLLLFRMTTWLPHCGVRGW